MKTLGLCFLFLVFILVGNASAQQPSGVSGLNTDQQSIQKWLARSGQTGFPKTEGNHFLFSPEDDGVFLSLGDEEPSCAYMRTYRMKREAADSDVTRPAGYTTCVPVGRFAVKRAVVVPSE